MIHLFPFYQPRKTKQTNENISVKRDLDSNDSIQKVETNTGLIKQHGRQESYLIVIPVGFYRKN